MAGYPLMNVVDDPIFLSAIPVGLAMNGVYLGVGIAGAKLTYNYIFDVESSLEDDIVSPIITSIEIGFAIGLTIIGKYSLFKETQTDWWDV